jgi:hypothetical protein
MNHTSVTYTEPPIVNYDFPPSTEYPGGYQGSGSGLIGIGLDTVEKIHRDDFNALSYKSPSTLYCVYD